MLPRPGRRTASLPGSASGSNRLHHRAGAKHERLGPSQRETRAMKGIHLDPDDPPIVEAVEELKQTILSRFPDAELAVGCGDDPVGVYIQATVDIDDLDEVI